MDLEKLEELLHSDLAQSEYTTAVGKYYEGKVKYYQDAAAYYKAVADGLLSRGYKSAPDFTEVHADFSNKLSPEDSVQEYVNAWGDPDENEEED